MKLQEIKVAYFEVSADADIRIYIRDISGQFACDGADYSAGTSFQVRTNRKRSIQTHNYSLLILPV
jgi:hypothetical protein